MQPPVLRAAADRQPARLRRACSDLREGDTRLLGCGVTPQAVAERARVELMITHEPVQMFLTDLPREGENRPNE
jgi:hypothetical protein